MPWLWKKITFKDGTEVAGRSWLRILLVASMKQEQEGEGGNKT